MNVILYALGAGLMIVGAVELVRMLAFRLNRTGGSGKGSMTLVVCPQDPETCETLVLAGLERVRWMSLRPPCRLVCLYEGNGECREILDCLAKTYQELELLSPGQLEAWLAEKQ